MPFTLPALPYAPDALEPSIDKLTMEIHHGKHHNAYVTNLNKALESAPELANKSLEELLANNLRDRSRNAIKTAVRNNAGGHINHSMFWQIMGPNAGGQPGGALEAAIKSAFGDFNTFKEKLSRRRHGPLWLRLGMADSPTAASWKSIPPPTRTARLWKANSPCSDVDVWEHAYYLKYQNRRNGVPCRVVECGELDGNRKALSCSEVNRIESVTALSLRRQSRWAATLALSLDIA